MNTDKQRRISNSYDAICPKKVGSPEHEYVSDKRKLATESVREETIEAEVTAPDKKRGLHRNDGFHPPAEVHSPDLRCYVCIISHTKE